MTHPVYIQLAALEKEVKERAKKDTAKEELEAEQPIINPRLLITQGNGFVFELALVELQMLNVIA